MPLRRLLFFAALLPAAAFGQATPNYRTTITLASLLSGPTATPNAQICAVPVDSYDKPLTFSAPTWGLVGANSHFCQTVTNGAFPAAGLPVPDSAHTNASAAIFYDISIQPTDSTGKANGATIVLPKVPGISGPTYALDNFAPTVTSAAPASNSITAGPGIPTTCNAASLFFNTVTTTLYACNNGVPVPVSGGGSGGAVPTAAQIGALSLTATTPQVVTGQVSFAVPPLFPGGISVGTPGPATPYFNPPPTSGSAGQLLALGSVTTNSADGRPVDNAIYINPPSAATAITPSTIAGASAGSLSVAQPPAQFITFLAGYTNSTTTDQVITFAAPFTHPPLILSNTTGLQIKVTATTLTIVSPNSTTAYSGGVVLGGF